MFKNILNLIFGPSKPPEHGGLGAILNTPDNRDIATAMVRPTVSRETMPDSFTTDISMIAVMNQGWLGTCVAHALVTVKKWLDYKETGKLIPLSRRFLYAISRVRAGMSVLDGQGLPPRVAAKALCDVGTLGTDTIDNDTLTHEQYCNVAVTPEMTQDALHYETKGYAFSEMTAEGLMQDLIHFGLITITVAYDPNTWLSGFVRKVLNVYGYHQIVIYGYQKEGTDTRFFWRNSWGTWWGYGGNGEFLWSEYKDHLYDPMVFTDLPNDLIERAKLTQFIFLRDLKFGSFGEDVVKLQQRMRSYGYFTYPLNTRFFGSATKAAVVKYQVSKLLTGDGLVGPKTRAALNDMTQTNETKSKIDEWCNAIAAMEKAKPELNNPGNIRYIGQAKAIGKDYRGFCIFATYADGYMALRTLLVNACTGRSKIYKPDMTLYEFYSHYAPSNDGNFPNKYAEFVAKKLGVEPSIKIKELL